MYALILVLCLNGECYESAPAKYDTLVNCVRAAFEAQSAIYDHAVIRIYCSREKR